MKSKFRKFIDWLLGIEETQALIKQDAVKKDVELKIIEMYLNKGLSIVGFKILNPMSRETAMEFYAEHKDQDFFDGLINFMTEPESITICLVLRGRNAIKKVRELTGATNPTKAAPGTIRQLYGTGGPANAAHSSANKEASKKEREIITKC